MKKISFILVLVFCLTASNIYGKQISIDEAQSLALNHMRRNHDPRIHGTEPVTQQLELVLEAKSNSLDVDYYVFNKGKCDGYIIVSGDDKAAPVLGFSDEGTFDINNIPDGLQYWLEVYSQEMHYLRSNPNAQAASIRSNGRSASDLCSLATGHKVSHTIICALLILKTAPPIMQQPVASLPRPHKSCIITAGPSPVPAATLTFAM